MKMAGVRKAEEKGACPRVLMESDHRFPSWTEKGVDFFFFLWFGGVDDYAILHFSEHIFASLSVHYIVEFPEKYGKFYNVLVMWKCKRLSFAACLEVLDV